MIKTVLVAAALAVASSAAQAAIPAFNATCGEKTTVTAAAGGPIKIGGKDAKIITEKDGNYYEAKRRNVTVTLTVAADGAVTLAYTKKKKETDEKGTCTIKA
jgi:hypothetical protein